jgi:hypothetical protein
MSHTRNTYHSILFLLSACLFFSNSLAQRLTTSDTTIVFTPSNPTLIRLQSYRPLVHAWGLDILMSNNGFGLGAFYRYEMTDELSIMVNFAISDVKDEAEVEQFDYFGQSIIPGKKNRLLLMPLIASVQYRLFKDDIVDNFQPFITAGLGPTMVFVAPYAHPTTYYYPDSSSYTDPGKIDFFTSLKYGKLRYTLGGFIGVGAYFGLEKGSISGLSVKYYLAPFPDGIEIMDHGYIKNFGGLFITLTFGSLF